jgi:Flp pilus assembly protein TadG
MILARIACVLAPLRRDERGVSVIEFALVAPIMMALILGVTDLSRAFATRLTLQQAANRAIEKAGVGTVQSDYNYLKADAATAAGVAQTAVTVDSWVECDGTRQATFASECTTAQQIARYVQVTVNANFAPMFSYGPLGRNVFATAADGTVPMTGKAALRIQ